RRISREKRTWTSGVRCARARGATGRRSATSRGTPLADNVSTFKRRTAMSSAVDMPEILDWAQSPSDYGAAVLEAFSPLPPGQRIRLRCPQAPWSTLHELQRERRGAFEWSPVCEGPSH